MITNFYKNIFFKYIFYKGNIYLSKDVIVNIYNLTAICLLGALQFCTFANNVNKSVIYAWRHWNKKQLSESLRIVRFNEW